jgi:hypothetical protein
MGGRRRCWLVPVYHQMGHHSENLLTDPRLSQYSGAVLSPVNYREPEIRDQIGRTSSDFETVFDPQLYYPQTLRGCLRDWSYFPDDVDTADRSSEIWWRGLIDNIIDTCTRIRVDAICSPVIVTRVFSNEYLADLVRYGTYLADQLFGSGIRSMQTIVMGLAELSSPRRGIEVASIASRTRAEGIYLVLAGDTDPRRELSNPEELKGAMRLIGTLESVGLPVLVGFSSSDMVLWKAAGASTCATGKFFNLRRFTSSRFEDTSQGGGQLPYWFEEALLAFLREADLLRVRARQPGMISAGSLRNPLGTQILENLESASPEPWLADSWRQFMYAFASLEHRISAGSIDVSEMLREAERNWVTLEDASVLMDERRNDGTWLRSWRQALAEYPTY